MNHNIQETRAPRASLILTVPAYGFVVALPIDCLGWFSQGAFSDETLVTGLKGSDHEQELLLDGTANPGF
jgi:hypothetical protein